MTESYKNILLDIAGFTIVSFGIKTEDVFTTIFGLLIIF